jgi:hypothetical protein
MSHHRKFSQIVADLLPETGGWVDATQQMSPADAAKALLDALTKLVDSETKARALLAEIPEAAAIVALLPARRRGRPATSLQQRKDYALLDIYKWKAAEGKSVRAVARYLHKHHGIGKNAESVERKLHRLLNRRSHGSK